ncbi:MAG: DUF3298 and DUF4163 domain-containing protein [Brevibacillus sp.]|nr:DUF3298 and DUF4163 domain-containing protein [Brevibacillus sp.]
MELNQLPSTILTRTITHPKVTIYIPQLANLQNRQAEAHINKTINRHVNEMIKRQGYYEHPAQTEMQGMYEIKSNERGLVSLTLSNYAYTYPMAHGLTLMRSVTADVQTGRIYSLSELFKPGSDYVGVLSEMVRQQIRQRQIPTLSEFVRIRPDQDYYIADKALVLYFQTYEISPYYVGLPMFPISVYDLQSIIDEDGPLGIMSAQ